MIPRCMALALALCFAAMPSALGQTLDQCNAIAARGDYAGGIRCIQGLQGRQANEIAQRQAAMVYNAMHDPECWTMYQRFLASGRRTPYDQFAYEWLATAHFTPDGIARFRQSEAENQAKEAAAVQALRGAEEMRGKAQIGYWEGYFRQQNIAGYGLQGQGLYTDPNTGSNVPLQNVRPGRTTIGPDGTQYRMDDQGTYYASPPGSGRWSTMSPVR